MYKEGMFGSCFRELFNDAHSMSVKYIEAGKKSMKITFTPRPKHDDYAWKLLILSLILTATRFLLSHKMFSSDAHDKLKVIPCTFTSSSSSPLS
jgi:hypothetical protein